MFYAYLFQRIWRDMREQMLVQPDRRQGAARDGAAIPTQVDGRREKKRLEISRKFFTPLFEQSQYLAQNTPDQISI